MKSLLLSLLLLLQLPVNAQVIQTSDDTLQSLQISPVSFAPQMAIADTLVQEAEPAHKTFLRTAALATTGVGLWAATFTFADEPLQQFVQSHRNSATDAISGAVEPLGHCGNLAPVALAAVAGGLAMGKPKLTKVGVVAMGSLIASGAVTNLLKNSFHRHRPSSTTENHLFDGPMSEKDNTSLPSAHTTVAFAMATSVATVYSDYKFVAPVAYGVATLVGLSRINDNAHWATDVIAGASIGYFSAKGISALYKIGEDKLHLRKQRLLLTPQLSTKSAALSATFTF